MSGFGIWNVVFVLWLHYSHWENCLFQSCNDDELNVEATEFLIVSLANRFKGSSYPFQMSLYLFGYFFYVDVHVFCFFLWMVFVCFFGFFFVKTHLMLLFLISCQEYFNAFFPVCLFISFRKMLFWNASQNMRLKIFWRQQLWHNKIKKDTKIRCQNKKEMSTGVSFFFLFLRMKTIFKQNIWRLFAFSINCASLVEIELEQK